MDAAVVVLYYPDKTVINEMIEVITGDNMIVFLIDNTPGADLSSSMRFPDSISYIPLGENRGIAYAQNVGIRNAIAADAAHILFLDQDSVPQQGMAKELRETFSYLKRMGINTGAVSPAHMNRQTGKLYPEAPVIGEFAGGTISEVRELISSGTYADISIFKDGDMMDESLFIDGVDHEWCWRIASSHGYRFFIANNLILGHSLGSASKKIGNHESAVATPARTFYLYRNYLRLTGKRYVPRQWKVSMGVSLTLKILQYLLFTSPRGEYASNIFRGIKEGIRAKEPSKEP